MLDVQRELPAVIGAKAGSNVTHYMHGPLGMFAQRNPDASWDWMLHDGLGSVRGVFDETLQSAAEYDPFGEPIVAPAGTAYGFTGELTDGNGLVYLRARYLAPGLGTFASRDPWRGTSSAPHTWNSYAWVEGNVVNRVDGSGLCAQVGAQSACEICKLDYETHRRLVPNLPYTLEEYCGSSCAQPNEAPSSALSVVLFGGSTGDVTQQGPRTECQTPVWHDIAKKIIRYPGTGEPDSATGFVGKRLHALLAGAPIENMIVVGYSAGADSALIYAHDHRTTGFVRGVVLLDGPLDGIRTDGRALGCFVGDSRPGCVDGRDANVWRSTLDDVLAEGIDVYFLDDGAEGGQSKVASYEPPSGSPGMFRYDARLSVEHFQGGLTGLRGTGTNNSETICREVLTWFGQDTSQCEIAQEPSRNCP